MSFFSRFFGKDEQPEEAKPRVWPRWRVDEDKPLSAEELQRQKFYYTRVFLLKNDDDRKRADGRKYRYVALTPSINYGGKGWQLRSYSYNDGDRIPNEKGETYIAEAETAVQQLVDFEQDMIARGNVALTGSTQNFEMLAVESGCFINARNEVFRVDGGARLTEKTAMPAAAALSFYHAAGTAAPTSSWAWFYERYVDSMGTRFAGQIEKLQQESEYPHAMRRFRQTLDTLRVKEDAFAKSSQASTTSRVNILSDMIQGPRTACARLSAFMDKKAKGTLEYAMHMSTLATILRAGAHTVEHEADMTDRGVNYEKLRILQALRRAAQIVITEDLKLGEAEGEAIINVMLRGADPRQGAFPLETLFQAFPPVKPAPDNAGPKGYGV